MRAGGRRSAAIPPRRRRAVASKRENRMVSAGGDAEEQHEILRAVENVKELPIRGIILGALITVIFTAANVYLGLKIGITFATSIPAAVISMAILRAFRDSTIQENN